jgi:hypothetical protein
MFDLAGFEKRLNSDVDLQKAFFRDPVRTLTAAGLILSPAMKKELRSQIRRVKRPKTPVAGAAVKGIGKQEVLCIGTSIKAVQKRKAAQKRK